VLVAAEDFGGTLDATMVARAIDRGLRAGAAGRTGDMESDPGSKLEIDLCPIATDSAKLRSDFDVRMRAARAVVIAAPHLDHETLLQRGAACEIATRARQAGVPCYAVAGSNAMDLFELRMLDLQAVLQAGTFIELRAAGDKLGGLI
jgi:hypothetical protein